ncbi:isoamylase 2, chloroplastic-like isoform X1 [Telopea speciosissima]|uniref:isoamylase 2, chloroplastic-like isoform X1 n=1 Tax=Telopea speciosissima TaxID=54955 RepID=UPI001CC4BC85|nr:isoamylase 2, chloroplastic-like isoform X1 [Telopea speciosissima]
MAALQPSLPVQLHHPNHGAIKLAMLTTVSCYYDRRKRVHNVKKTEMGKNHFNRKGLRDLTGNIQRVLDVKIFAAPKISVDEIGTRLDSSKVEVEKGSTYAFRTEFGGLVKVFVGRKNMKYAINIEVSSLPVCGSEDKLVLSWGLFRSDSSCFMPLAPQSLAPETRSNTFETPFEQKTLARYALQLEFESNEAPFYLSFILYSSGSGSNNIRIRSHRKTNFCVPVGISSGYPAPLGVSFSSDGSVNFALFSSNAESVVLCLQNEMTDQPSLEIDLDPYINRTGDIWHVSMESVGPYVCYSYRCRGTTIGSGGDRLHEPHVLLDPYAKILKYLSPDQPGSISLRKCLGHLRTAPAFDWAGDVHPRLQMETLVVYRLNVKHFTEDRSSQVTADVAGTFSGVVEKLNHFKGLGVNAILLEPLFPFDKQEGPYFPYHFFSPVNLYGPTHDGISTINALKEMVKRLHASGIEVLLEVVFTHIAETGDSSCRMGALRGIDNSSYFVADGDVDSRTRNALNCNYPIVQRMILDSLQHWVTEFHIDGFVFMDASSLLRGSNGEYLSRPPLVEAIAFDPLLSKSKIIADCWDPSGVVSKEIRFPHWKKWAEMNTRFCHDVRQFLRGEGVLSNLATRLCGSGDIFSDGRGPAFSFNFIARNSGLPLVDLVSFSSNELSSELSWNCGEEGPTNRTVVLEKRLKQIRNFLFILYISLGVPVLNMGDECGESAGGSPSYGDRKSFDWGALKTGFGVQTTKFIRFLSSLRMRRCDLLHKRNFMREENIDWHGSDQSQPRWEDPSCKFLAMTLKVDRDNSQFNSKSSHIVGDLYIASNSSDHPEIVILPPPTEGMTWLRLVDTALLYPGFFSTSGDPVLEQMKGLLAYEMMAHSCVLFEAQSLSG